MPLGDGAEIAGYTIQRRLGSGGTSEVYLARHPSLPRDDALRVFEAALSANREFIEQFDRELALAAEVGHPHIVGLHDRGSHAGRLWLSMDYVDGTDVGRLLRENPSGMPPEEAIEILSAVAEALDFAHERGLFHRDVKPANILVAHEDHRILLGDFGMARDHANDNGKGASRAAAVTYAAPEQLISLGVDGRTDQYALAATAVHMLTGAPPFQGSDATVVIGQHLYAKPPSVSSTHPELAALDATLSRALAKDPEKRFASCAEFVQALNEG